MSSKIVGAASAAPTLTELAKGIRADLAGIKDDSRAALAKALAAGEKLNQAKAQLGHGDWLPWLEKNFPGAERTAQQYMKLATANPHGHADFDSIQQALAAIPTTSKPPRERKRDKNTTPAQATQRLRRRVREVQTKDSRVRPRWTLEDTADVKALIASKREGRESGKRLRELHSQRRNGRGGDLWSLQKAVALAVSELEFFDLPNLDWSEETEMLVAEIYDDLGRHARWNDEALAVVAAHMDDLGRQRKIQALRVRADDPSSTQSERETAARLADRLMQPVGAARVPVRAPAGIPAFPIGFVGLD